MKTIAFISNHTSDLINFRAVLIRTLHQQGVRVLAIAPNFDENTRDAVRALGAEPLDYSLRPTGMNPFADLLGAFQLMRLLKVLKPDVVFARAAKPVIYGSLAAWWANVPRRIAMIEGLGFVFTPGAGRPSFKRRALKWLVMGLYFVIPSSTAVDRVALYLQPLQLMVFANLPEALGRRRCAKNGTAIRSGNLTNSGWVLLVLAYYGAVEFVWLNFASHAPAWLPYRFYPLVWIFS